MSKKEIVEDFLEADPEIPGQKYVCLSFVSPENILANKDMFHVNAFLKTIAPKYDLDADSISEKYKDFLYVNEQKLEKEFYEKNDFRTTIRGLKVRGVYDTHREAEHRCKKIQTFDKNFSVFIGQVGFWLPWDPNPHNIDKQEYQEAELNELVSKYRENQEKKDAHFQENIEYVREQQEKENQRLKAERENKDGEQKVNDSLNDIDPWMKNKEETKQD
uniref:Uncharacterized protein n=1 Tax=viral metagenome TaxID=1070528 RepID=A0A6C0JER6_9ZZZZ